MENDYTGTDNLEVMAAALNYNKFLTSLVVGEVQDARTIVDFGAGIGTFAKCLTEAGYEVSCVEPDQNQALTMKEMGLNVVPALEYLGETSVDYLYSLNVLEHIENDEEVLRDIYTRMAKGGRVLIYVPAFPLLYSSMDEKVGHVRRYTKRELQDKLRRAGFHVRKLGYVDSLGFVAALLFKYFGNDDGDINRTALVAYDRFAFPISRVMDALFSPFLGKNVIAIAEK